MIIRLAHLSDLPAVLEIQNAFIRDTFITFNSQEKTISDLEKLKVQRSLLVAIADEKVVGFVSFRPFRDGPGYAHVAEHTIAISPNAQRKGLGSSLMTALEIEARRQGIDILVAGISSANPQGQRFHKACGFQQTGYMPGVGRKFGQTLDLILMQKVISQAHEETSAIWS